MNEVDERVAKISFDNEAFEKRAAESLNTINKINEAIEFKGQKNSFDSLIKLANGLADSTADISYSVQSLSDRFSTFGIMGMQVIQNMTNGLINLGTTMVNKVYDPIVNGGMNRAKNLEQARFMLNGLIDDAEGGAKRVEQILNGPVNDAVSGTRFGLDEAAVAASNLYASGVTDDNELTESLQAISGAASMANREYGDMAQIFAAVKSNGKLMTMQLRQFSAMGMNVAVTLQKWYKEAKGVEYTENQINDMVSKGKVSYEAFAKAMHTYWDQASKANDTYSGAASNFRAALARIGAEFQSKNLVQMRKWFNSLIPLINYIKTTIPPLVEMYDKAKGNMRNGIMGLFVAGTEKKGFVVLQQFKDFLEALMGTIVAIGNAVSHTTETVGSYIESIVPTGGFEAATNGLNKLKDAINGLIDPENSVLVKNWFGSDDSVEDSADAVKSEIKEIQKIRKIARDNMVTYSNDEKKATELLEEAKKNLAKLEKKNKKEPSEDTAKEIEAQKKAIKALDEKLHKAQELKKENEEAYLATNKVLKDERRLLYQLGENNIDVFLESIAQTLVNIGTIANRIIEPFKARKRTILNVIKDIAGNIYNLQIRIDELFMELSTDTKFMSDIQRIGRGFYAVFHIILQLINSIVKAVVGVPSSLKGPIESFADFVANIADWVYAADLYIEKTKLFDRAIKAIVDFIRPAVEAFKGAVKWVLGFFNSFGENAPSFGGIVDVIVRALERFNANIKKGADTVGTIKDVFNGVVEYLKGFSPVFKAIATVFESVFGVIAKIFQNTKDTISGWTLFDLLNAILALINKEAIATALALFQDFIGTFANTGKVFSTLFMNINNAFVEVGKSLAVWQRSIKADVIMKIAIAIGILTLSLTTLANIDPKGMEQAIGALFAIAVVLGVMFTLYEKLNVISAITLNGPKDFLTYFMHSMDNMFTKGKKAWDALVLIEIAGAIFILATAVAVLAKSAENPAQLWQGVGALAAIMAMLFLFQQFSDSTLNGKVGRALIKVSVAVKIMANVMKSLSETIANDPWNALNALLMMELILVELGTFLFAMSKIDMWSSKARGFAKSMITIGLSMEIFAHVIKQLSATIASDPWNALNALLMMELIFVELGTFLFTMSKIDMWSTKAKGFAGAMVTIGISLEIFAHVIKQLSATIASDPWNALNALLMMELIFAEIASIFLAVKLIKIDNRQMKTVAGTLLIFGVAMNIMAKAVKDMAFIWQTDWKAALAGMGAFAGLLAMFFAITYFTISNDYDISKPAKSLILFAVALNILAGALVKVGSMEIPNIIASFIALAALVGVFYAITTAMTTTTAVLGPGIAIILSIAAAIFLFAAALALTSAAVTQFAAATPEQISSFFDNIKQSIEELKVLLPVLLTFFASFIAAAITAIGDSAMEIAGAVVNVFINILEAVRDNLYRIVDLVLDIITEFLRAIGDNIQSIVEAGLYIVTAFLQGLAEGLPGLIDAATDVIVAFLDGIAANSDRIALAGMNLVISLALAVARATILLVTVAGAMMHDFLEEIGLADTFDAGVNLIMGLIEGIGSVIRDVVATAAGVAEAVLVTMDTIFEVNSPSKYTTRDGQYLDEGLIAGMESERDAVNTTAESVAGGAVQKFSDALKEIQSYKRKIASEAASLHGDTQYGIKGQHDYKSEIENATKQSTEATKNSALDTIKSFTDKAKDAAKDINPFKDLTEGTSLFADEEDKAKKKADELGKSVGDATDTGSKGSKAAGKEVEKYAVKYDILTDKIKKLGKAFVNGGLTAKGDAKKAGKQLGDAFYGAFKVVSGNTKQYRSYIKGLKGDLKKFISGSELSKYSKLANSLYLKSDAFKSSLSELKGYYKEYRSQLKELEKAQKKTDNAQEVENIKKSLDETAQKIKKVGKAITSGPAKALKAFRKEVKSVVKDYLAFSNISFEAVLDPQSNVRIASRTETLVNNLSGSLKTATEVAKSTSDQFDIMGASMSTGINLLERFSKVSTYTTRRLMTNAQSQIKAYEEMQAGIQALRDKGLDSDFVDSLEAQGPEALGYVRGFEKMTAEEISKYNEMVQKQKQYQSQQLEKNIEQTVEQYRQYYEDVEELAARGLSEGIINRLKEGGIEQATFVKALLGFTDEGLERVTDFYAESVEAADAASEVRESEEKTYKSFSEMLEGQVQQKNEWEAKIQKLRDAGISKDLIQSFKDWGYESGKEYMDQVLKEIAKPGGADKINKAMESLLAGTDDPGLVWLRNLKASRHSYEEYEENLQKLADSLPKGESDPVYKYVKSLGWEEGAEYARAYIESSEEQQKRIRVELKYQREINRKQIVEDLKERMQAVQDWAANLEKIANKKYKTGKHKGESIISQSLMSELVAMGPEAAAEIEAIASMGNKELLELTQQWGDAAKLPDSVQSMVTDSYAQTAGDAVTAVKDKIGSTEAKDGLTSAAKTTITEAAKAVKSHAKTKAGKVGEAMKDGVKTYVNATKGKQLATNLCEGLVKGIENGTGIVVDAAKKLGKDTIKGLKDATKVKSPSKLTEEVGMFLDQGLANGMSNNLRPVLTAAGGVADSIYGSFVSLNDKIQNGVFQPVDYGVNLTPMNTMLDLSANIAQAKDIMDIFSSISGVNFEIGRDANRDVVNAINDMRDDFEYQIDKLSTAINDMQLIMDTGALVGQIVSPMDQALGQNRALAQRGVLA